MNKERNETVSGSALPARRDYKDTIFRRLFQDRENLLSLYKIVSIVFRKIKILPFGSR